jgi:hypothetical protein
VENVKKNPSWALSYQEWQSYISSGQNYHDGEIEASAVGNKEVESEEEASDLSSEDSDKSAKSSDDYDREAANTSNNKKEGANNVCDWGQVIQCNHTQLPPLKCQKDECNHLVHHLCQGNWEWSNSHSDTVAHYCFSHHPNNMSNGDIFGGDDELLNVTGKTVDS